MVERGALREIFERGCEALGLGAERLVVGVFVVHPEHAGPEARTPFVGRGLAAVPERVGMLDVARHHGVDERVGLTVKLAEGLADLRVAVCKRLVDAEIVGGFRLRGAGSHACAYQTEESKF